MPDSLPDDDELFPPPADSKLRIGLWSAGIVLGIAALIMLAVAIASRQNIDPPHPKQKQVARAAPPRAPILPRLPVVPIGPPPPIEWDDEEPIMIEPERPIVGQPAPAPKAKPKGSAKTVDVEDEIAELESKLRSSFPWMREQACQRLGMLGTAASRLLCEGILDTNDGVRLAASSGLGRANPKLAKVARPLAFEGSGEKRIEYLKQLREMKADGAPAVPIVKRFLTGRRAGPEIAAAIETLAAIVPKDADAARAALKACRHSREEVRLAAVKALPSFAIGQAAVDELVEVTRRRDSSIELRAAALRSLGAMGSKARSALPAVEMAKTSSSHVVRDAAAEAADKIKVR